MEEYLVMVEVPAEVGYKKYFYRTWAGNIDDACLEVFGEIDFEGELANFSNGPMSKTTNIGNYKVQRVKPEDTLYITVMLMSEITVLTPAKEPKSDGKL